MITRWSKNPSGVTLACDDTQHDFEAELHSFKFFPPAEATVSGLVEKIYFEFQKIYLSK